MVELINYGTNEYSKIKKQKRDRENLPAGKTFENEMWLFLDYLEPTNISKGPVKLSIKLNKISEDREVDILAEFDDFFLAIECKEGETHRIQEDLRDLSSIKDDVEKVEFFRINKDIEEIALKKTQIQNAVLKGKDRKNVIFLLAYKDQDPNEKNYKYALEKNILLWNKKHLDFYSEIASKLKKIARDIIFSDLLKGHRIGTMDSKDKNIPAIRGQMNGITCYSFMLSPYILKMIGYVNRRNLQHEAGDDELSYQRILDTSKIKNIGRFLQDNEKGKYGFPTSVLLNFKSSGLKFTKAEKKNSQIEIDNVEYGWLEIPKIYGSAYIIDGQHRIFGYSGLNEMSQKHFLNVIAFENLKDDDQAKIFVDINQNQKPISADNLWDLYTDIFSEDSNRDEYFISNIIKNLNKKNDYFKDNIFIPSVSKLSKKNYRIYINNIASSLKKMSKFRYSLCKDDWNKYEEIISSYFNLFRKDESYYIKYKEFLNSNNGVTILLYVLIEFPEFIKDKDSNIRDISITKLKDYLANFQNTVKGALDRIGKEELKRWLSSRSGEAGRKNCALDIISKCADIDDDFRKISRKHKKYEEDKTTELKESICCDRDGNKNDELFISQNGLKPLCSFINSNYGGDIFFGISDSGEIKGIDSEFKEKFNSNKDNLKRYIQDMIKNNLYISSEKLKTDIINSIEFYIENPIILKISVPKERDEVSFVSLSNKKGEKEAIPYIRQGAESRRLEKEFIISELGEDRANKLNKLKTEYYEKRS